MAICLTCVCLVSYQGKLIALETMALRTPSGASRRRRRRSNYVPKMHHFSDTVTLKSGLGSLKVIGTDTDRSATSL